MGPSWLHSLERRAARCTLAPSTPAVPAPHTGSVRAPPPPRLQHCVPTRHASPAMRSSSSSSSIGSSSTGGGCARAVPASGPGACASRPAMRSSSSSPSSSIASAPAAAPAAASPCVARGSLCFVISEARTPTPTTHTRAPEASAPASKQRHARHRTHLLPRSCRPAAASAPSRRLPQRPNTLLLLPLPLLLHAPLPLPLPLLLVPLLLPPRQALFRARRELGGGGGCTPRIHLVLQVRDRLQGQVLRACVRTQALCALYLHCTRTHPAPPRALPIHS